MNSQPIIIFGETFIDLFPDGNATLGGAPFNVAWHLQALGLAPLFITRVGNDAHGELYLEKMRQWGMRTDGVQIDATHPTGSCRVYFDQNGEPQFESAMNQALDFVELSPALKLINNDALFYHGSLITRSPVSNATLEGLFSARRLRRVFDVNLRTTHTSVERVRQLLPGSYMVKCNLEEFAAVTQRPVAGESLLGATPVFEEFSLGEARLFTTLGADGAALIRAKQSTLFAAAPEVEKFVDTVGAGDAFCAAVIFGDYNRWDAATGLDRATQFASSLCAVRGAIVTERRFYEQWLRRW